MYNIDFYRTENENCDIEEFLDDLQSQALINKDARIQHKQVTQYIQFLEDYGTRLGEKVTKHLDDGIWELRPGNNRVLFFYLKMIHLYFFIIFGRRHKRLRGEK